MSQSQLSLAEIDAQAVVDLPERRLFARAVGAGGLVGIGVAIDTVNVPITVEDNQICVNVAVASAAVGCAR